MKKRNKSKYYGVYSKSDNFLYGVFPFSKDGFKLAEAYILTIKSKKNTNFYIKKK